MTKTQKSEIIGFLTEDVCKTVLEDVIKFQKNVLFDDITILFFQRKQSTRNCELIVIGKPRVQLDKEAFDIFWIIE